MLYLTELFYSIQGEALYSGFPTVFVRLSGCNLRCTWCDTPNSFPRGTPSSVNAIIEQIKHYPCKHVCITGGEPLLQKEVYPLMTKLCDLEYQVSIETGGSLSVEQIDKRVHIVCDIKCPGSGMEQKNYWPNLKLLRASDELKFVLLDRKDYDYAKEKIKPLQTQPILFSPVHEKLKPQTLAAWILEDRLPVRLNLQIHKYLECQ